MSLYDYRVSDTTVLLVGDLAWPLVVLVVAVLLLASQRAPIGGLISRIRSLKYPGGEAQLGNVVPDEAADVFVRLVETLPRDLGDRLPRAVAGIPASDRQFGELLQNREPPGESGFLPTEEVANLVMLRTKVTNLLAELAFPPPPGGLGAVPMTIDVLLNRGVIDTETARALRDAVNVADQAAGGATVPRKVAAAVENAGPAILEQLALLGKIAAPRFEEHVLDTLHENLPDGWSVETDAALDGPGAEAADGSVPVARRHVRARVDALVHAGESETVVEVRARLRPGLNAQIAALREWLGALPPGVPVLLVVPGDGLTVGELRRLRGSREGPLELLQWDRDAESLIPVLRSMAESPPAVALGAG